MKSWLSYLVSIGLCQGLLTCDVTLGRDRSSCGEICKKLSKAQCKGDDSGECLVFSTFEILSYCDAQVAEIGFIFEFLFPMANYNVTFDNLSPSTTKIVELQNDLTTPLTEVNTTSYQFENSPGPEFSIISTKAFGLVFKEELNFTIKIQSKFHGCPYPSMDCEVCCHADQTCRRKDVLCDGIWDCPDGEDEWTRYCGKDDGHTYVGQNLHNVVCPIIDGAQSSTIPISYICDGVEDCTKLNHVGYAEDETECAICRHGAFHCIATNSSSSRCITEQQTCDGYQDCPDGSDELNCPMIDQRQVLTAAIIGSLGCCALFVIALGCTRRLLYVQSLSSCSRARRSLQHLANILQVREAPPTYDAAMGYDSTTARPSRSRPWRLTRSGLRRESRRARRRRIHEADNSSIDLPSVIEEQPIQRAGSVDSITSAQQTSQAVSPEPQPSTSRGLTIDEVPLQGGPAQTHEEDERKSISSQH